MGKIKEFRQLLPGKRQGPGFLTETREGISRDAHTVRRDAGRVYDTDEIRILRGEAARAAGCSPTIPATAWLHGANFPRCFHIRRGISTRRRPGHRESSARERWNGNRGMGCTNASPRWTALWNSRSSGVGCVAMRNTNHWMRGGPRPSGRVRLLGICWTNTMPNMPPWGAKDRRIGNNPIIMALPWKESPVLIDGALAQFSYGHRSPPAGGQAASAPAATTKGRVTTGPAAIEKTWRVPDRLLGSGFHRARPDRRALSRGTPSVNRRTRRRDRGHPDLPRLQRGGDAEGVRGIVVEGVLSDLKQAAPSEPGAKSSTPARRRGAPQGELELGIPVNKEIWGILRELA